MIDPLSLLVASAVKHAKDNHIDIWIWSDDEIADDLVKCDSEIAAYDWIDVLKYVKIQRPRD